MATISRQAYEALADSDKNVEMAMAWEQLPKIEPWERESGDVTLQWYEAFKLVGDVPELFRMEMEGFPDQMTKLVIVRGVPSADVYRLLRRWEGIVYARDQRAA